MPPLTVAGRITQRGGACADMGVTRSRGPVLRGVGDSSAIFSVMEEPNAGESHRHAVLVGRADHLHRDHTEIAPRVRQDWADRRRVSRHISAIYLGVGDGSAGGDDVLDATCRCNVEGVAEGEECVGGERHLPYKASVDRRSTGGISANDCVEIAEWARVTSLSVARNAAFSSRVSSGGGSANCSAHCAASVGAMSPSM